MKLDPATSRGAWLTPDWSVPAHVHALSTLRHGGVSTGDYASFNLAQHVGDEPSHVMANRARLRDAANLPAEPLWLEQVHGTRVAVHADASVTDSSSPPRADAAVAFGPGQVCVVMTADCLPVVFADRAGTRVGVAHAGWRGLAGGVLEATVDALQAPPGDLVAWLGPAIGAQSFEVGREVLDAFVARHADYAAGFTPNAAGRYQADLYTLARQALARVGVHDVTGGTRCTQLEHDSFFSYRRDAGRTGRMATLAWLEPTATASARSTAGAAG
jgi:YfiH family protein